MDEEIEAQKDDGEAAELSETDTEGVVPAGEEQPYVAEEAEATAMEELEEGDEVTAGAEVEVAETDAWAEAADQEEEYFTDQALEIAKEVEGEVEHVAEGEYEELVSPTHEARVVTAGAWEAVEGEARAIAGRLVAREYPRLSFQDGFRFGCGFTVAGCLVWLVVPLIVGLLIVVLTALNALG